MLRKSLANLFAFSFLVIAPNNARAVWDVQPSAGQVQSDSQILTLPAVWTRDQIQYMQSDGQGNAVYVAPAPPTPAPPGPDLYGFKTALTVDSNLPPPAMLYLAPYEAAMTDAVNAGDMTALQNLWAALKGYSSGTALAGTCTDGKTAVTTEIENVAATYRIPLLASP